jgi:hypothetical protein
MKIEIKGLKNKHVFSFEKYLMSGRTNNENLLKKCSEITYKQSCYYFEETVGEDNKVIYVGKYSVYKKAKSGQNFKERIAQYLSNHKSQKTNIKLFNYINEFLNDGANKDNNPKQINLGVFEFEALSFGNSEIGFEKVCENRFAIDLLERILIYNFKEKGECILNC